MKACEIQLDYDTVMSKVSRPLARKIEHSVELLRKSEKTAFTLRSAAARTANASIMSQSWPVSASRLT